ncbi:hypothetical protein FQN60_010617 [Etheostoma spectabile]|uniref:Condensin-2 complex subunit D3 n=1 Tax=Etheostoma spectabile TaxID=54343 RepID=A0A5J5CBG9_9PERO|nr:hypothetical protein FQN60_010617 [Etheostoma spectabile]
MDLISALQFLKLNELPKAWVDAVWDLEFTERHSLDENIAEELTGSGDKAFITLYQCLLDLAAEQQQSAGRDGASQSVWAILGENEVSIKSLVAVLSFFVLTGKAKAANVQQRVNGLHAASLYLLLLGIPGSIANKVFHEVLLDTCSDLTSHCWPQDSGKKRKKDGLKSSQTEGKRSRPQRTDPPEMEVDEEEEEEEALHFSGRDLMKIRDAVVLLVQSLLRLLQTFSLKDRPQSASNCTRIFSKLLYFEPVIGEITFAAQKVFYQLLYVILMMNKGKQGKPSLLVPSQAILSTRDQAIHFALVGLLKHNVIPMSWENLAILSERCRDPAVSVKKKALHVRRALTAKPECSVVERHGFRRGASCGRL